MTQWCGSSHPGAKLPLPTPEGSNFWYWPIMSSRHKVLAPHDIPGGVTSPQALVPPRDSVGRRWLGFFCLVRHLEVDLSTENHLIKSEPGGHSQLRSRMAQLRQLASYACALLSTILAGSVTLGCAPGHVGDPCVPEDEYTATFSGFGATEANVESRSFQCETRVCIANHFRGRVTCPYGQTSDYVTANASNAANVAGTPDPGLCYVPGSNAQAVSVAVDPQLVDRQAEDTVYCSCRCDGPDKSAHYCTCPEGFSCTPLLPDLGFHQEQLVGSYCLKDATQYAPATQGASCSSTAGNCPSDRASKKTRNPPP